MSCDVQFICNFLPLQTFKVSLLPFNPYFPLTRGQIMLRCCHDKPQCLSFPILQKGFHPFLKTNLLSISRRLLTLIVASTLLWSTQITFSDKHNAIRRKLILLHSPSFPFLCFEAITALRYLETHCCQAFFLSCRWSFSPTVHSPNYLLVNPVSTDLNGWRGKRVAYKRHRSDQLVNDQLVLSRLQTHLECLRV